MKGWGLFAAIVAVAGLLGTTVGLTVEFGRQRAAISAWTSCAAAVGHERGARPVAEACVGPKAQPIAVAALAAERSASCDTALLAEDAYAVRASCSTAVKTTQAQRDAARTERDGFQADLARLRVDQAAAINRAETRARRDSERTTHAQAAIAAAPRLPDGRVQCDARCLRDLTGSEARPPG